ncbi:MAG: hypothetical protein F4W92_06380 [Gammaproteobacteria bacterium]|nr:hypothetical protein [Gammaproteobacteria bacterium]
MKRLWQICFADTRVGFDGLKESPPILFPAIFSLICLTLQCVVFLVLIIDWDATSASDSVSNESWLYVNFALMWAVRSVLYPVAFVCTWWFITSMYYFGIARLFNISTSWKNWLGFSCWSSIPLITVPVFLVIAIAVQAIPIPGREVDPWYIETISTCMLAVPFMWCTFISALGLRSWTEAEGRGNVYWRIVAFVPYGLLLSAFMIFGVWIMRWA